MKTNETTTENQTQQSPEVGCCELLGFNSECKKEFRWRTEDHHWDNMETMNDFLNHEMPTAWAITLIDGTYAEVMMPEGTTLALSASGDGDSRNHLVTATVI